jgi:hypothetical protein
VDCTLSCLAVLPSQEGENVSNASDNLDTSGERGRAGYTPGPWAILDDDARGKPRCLILNDRLQQVAEVNPHFDAWEANARLIAAAPELLEACGLALQRLQFYEIYGPARNACEAAIKKATGE